MSIEQELIKFLDENMLERDTKGRNIEIIAYYYGFRMAQWPTLEETAEHFEIGTRERVRQIIADNFRKIADLEHFPSLINVGEIVESNRYWAQSELEKEVTTSNLAGDSFSIRGLLNMLNDLGLDNDYEIYLPNLDKVTRQSVNKFEEYFVIKGADIRNIRSIYRRAQKLPGRCGISNLDYLARENNDFETYKNLLKNLIKYSEISWSKDDGDVFWYLFENRDNTLINFSEKVFSVIESCEIHRLSATYRNALDRRTYKYPYPPEEIITNYLKSSIYFEKNRDILTFVGEVTPLNDIEVDVVDYLKSEGTVKFPEFHNYLAAKGYGKPLILKSTNTSPLVHVDKRIGRQHYEYSLVGNIDRVAPEDNNLEDRYRQFLRKLRRISKLGTDTSVEQKNRNEQGLLRQWLFDGKHQEHCAICGNRYSVSAIVAAHKKRRANCNEAERLDPYIVMPICVFGCDYLYENGYIYIDDGVIRAGLPIEYVGRERESVNLLVGRRVDEEWLKGPDTYFAAPNPA